MTISLFSPGRIGPLKLRNRAIRSAAFEGMCPNGVPSESLIKYHRAVAAGGIGMTTVAYVSVQNNGRTFSHQAWMRPEIIPHLKKLTDAVHREGAAASIQLGHGGHMGDRKVTGERAISPSGKFNLYGLTLPRAMSESDIQECARAHGRAVSLAKQAGFDAVEIHAGHGYLISQFLSPYTNSRRDQYGGSLENRACFLRLVIREVKKAAGNSMAILVKANIEDGFQGGMDITEGIQVARIIEQEGADAIVLSGGFVSKTPFFMMKGVTPHRELISYQKNLFIKFGMLCFSRIIIHDYPYREVYFLDQAVKFRSEVNIPLVYVGGIVSHAGIQKALDAGFEFIALARALVAEPDFIKRIKNNPKHVSPCLTCGPSNSCVAVMYMGEMKCPYLEQVHIGKAN